MNPQAASEWAAAKKAWADIEAKLDAQSAVREAATPVSDEMKQRSVCQAKSRKRKRENRPSKGRLIPIDISNGLDSATETEITKQYRNNGLVMIKLLDQSACDDLVMEQWKEVMLKQPYTDEHKIKVTSGESGRQLDIDKDPREFLRAVTTAPLPKAVLKNFENGWCLHRGFGACCDPQVFHLPGVWKIREHPSLYKAACKLIGRKDIWVDINRSIQKLPGQGENEFLHWDMNPFASFTENTSSYTSALAASVSPAAKSSAACAAGLQGAAPMPSSATSSLVSTLPSTGLCGKVCYTTSRFVAVLGSHTEKFHREFVSKYAKFYPNMSLSALKFGLDFDKQDPMELQKRQREYHVPAGCVIFWHPNLLHGQIKTPLDAPIEYDCYLGYLPAISRDEYRKVCGVDELTDRKKSYQQGCAPKLWPSLDKIHHYPKRFQNFPAILQKYIDKMPSDHPSITTRTTKAGKTVAHLVPVPNTEYTPPALSSLGRKLLGLDDWITETSR